MRFIRLLLVMAGTGAVALSQTNSSANVRALSLQDCIELALRENLDLQIERVDVTSFLYNLRAAYGAYDPKLTISGEHDHSEFGSQLVVGQIQVPASVNNSYVIGGDLSGMLPWGMTYDLATRPDDTWHPH